MKGYRLIVAGALALLGSVALAGFVQPAPVIVTLQEDGSGSAQGDMVTARYSDNDAEFIGCGNRNFSFEDGNTFFFGFCQAGDSEGNEAFCNTNDPVLIEAMRATADNSFITFAFNAEGTCTRIGFSTQSFYLPEAPKTKKAK